MSSPLASLSKTRKVPLQSEPVNPGRRGIRIYGDEDEVDMLNDGNDSEEKISVPSCYGCIGSLQSSEGPSFHDSDLMASMARKLQDLEQQVKDQNDEILSKRFLKDYGLQWVGEPMDQEDSEHRTAPEDEGRAWMTAKKFWKPGDSLVPPEVDFDRLLASLQDLSELVVEGEPQVLPVPGGARLRVLEPIPLKLYRNGIMMFDGPFRPFHDPSTQRCLRDILDGFFPSELQRLYPEGVPFKVMGLFLNLHLSFLRRENGDKQLPQFC